MRFVIVVLGFAAGLTAAPFADEARQAVETAVTPLKPAAVAVAAPICTPVMANIYFQKGAASLSDAARSTIRVLGQRVQGCAIAAVAIENTPASVASEEGRRMAGLRGAGVLKALSIEGLAPETIIISESASGEPASMETPDYLRISIRPATPIGHDQPSLDDREI